METSKLRKQIDENTIVKTLVEVHNIRKISQAQMMDIFTLEPNRIAPIAERVHIFLEKISYLITMSKLQVQCEDKKFVDKHPQEYQAMQAYFADDGMNSNQF